MLYVRSRAQYVSCKVLLIFLCFICNISLCNTYVTPSHIIHTFQWLTGSYDYTVFQNLGRPLFLAQQTTMEMVSGLRWTLVKVSQIQIFPRPFQKVFDDSVTAQDSLISYEQTELISLECITSCVLLSIVNLTCFVLEENPKKVHSFMQGNQVKMVLLVHLPMNRVSRVARSGRQLPAHLNKEIPKLKNTYSRNNDSFY